MPTETSNWFWGDSSVIKVLALQAWSSDPIFRNVLKCTSSDLSPGEAEWDSWGRRASKSRLFGKLHAKCWVVLAVIFWSSPTCVLTYMWTCTHACKHRDFQTFLAFLYCVCMMQAWKGEDSFVPSIFSFHLCLSPGTRIILWGLAPWPSQAPLSYQPLLYFYRKLEIGIMHKSQFCSNPIVRIS